MREKLRLCPFCGKRAIINNIEPHNHSFGKFPISYDGETFIECTGCTCAISAKDEKEAIAVWNTRKPMEKVVEKLFSESLCASVDDDPFIMLDTAIEIVQEGDVE